MKRLSSSDSVIVIDGYEERSSQTTHIYSREFQSILDGYEDEEDCNEEPGRKKRRLSNEKVMALEKHFEVENKLGPNRKVKLASELGLQPRQVAVWFQNRRARWKTKQLEHDFGVLKSDYDKLKLSCESLQHDNDALLSEVKKLRDNLKEENRDTNHLALKEDIILPEAEKLKTPIAAALDSTELLLDNNEGANNNNSILILHDTKEGSSDDSDSSAILNEYNGNNSPIPAISSSGSLQNQTQISPTPSSSSLRYSCFSSSLFPPTTSFQFSDSRLAQNNNNGTLKAYYQTQQHVKVEEHNFFSMDEACNFFSDEQAPSMNWYCLDQWH